MSDWTWLALAISIAYAAWRDIKAPCVHGVTGAKRNRELCSECKEASTLLRRHFEALVASARREVTLAREQAFEKWRREARMPEYVRAMDPKAFEHLVCTLFAQVGYDVKATSYVSDGGIDGYLRRDGKLSLLQCKRVKGSVGEPVVRDLFGTLTAKKADEGIVVTTGSVSRQARRWIQGKPIRIIELRELVDLVRTHFDEADIVPEHFQLPPLARVTVPAAIPRPNEELR